MENTKQSIVDFEQVVSQRWLNDVVISPDGASVVYVSGEMARDDDHGSSAIWLVAADGSSQPRRLTAGEAADHSPRWSPDSRMLAFLSDRRKRGKADLYLLDLERGGEARRLTDHNGAVSDARWSPDGQALAYSMTPGETDEERQRREDRDDAIVRGTDRKPSELWLMMMPTDPAIGHLGTFPETRRLSPEGMHIGAYLDSGFDWLPDGSGLICVTGRSPATDDMIVPEIITISLDGNVRSLGRHEGLTAGPRVSPDGRTIALVAADTEIPARFVLHVMPFAGGEREVVLPGYEGSFFNFAWVPGTRWLVVLSEERQQNRLLVVDVDTRSVRGSDEPKDRPGSISGYGPACAVSGDTLGVAYGFADSSSFWDVYVRFGSEVPRRLTDLNPWTRDYAWGELREVRWTSVDGLEIEGLLILPVGYEEERRYPLLTHIHGGPAAAWTIHLYANVHDWGHLLAQRGYAVFMPNPRGSTGRGTEFLCGITGSYGEPDWQDIMSGVDYLIDQGIADPEKLVVGGWSGGGCLTNVTIVNTSRFKAAVSIAGTANWISYLGTADIRAVFNRYVGPVETDPQIAWRLSAIRSIANVSTPTLFLHGEQDPRVPVTQGYEMYEGVRAVGVETQMVVYPREGHGIEERKHQLDLLNRVVEWYERHLT